MDSGSGPRSWCPESEAREVPFRTGSVVAIGLCSLVLMLPAEGSLRIVSCCLTP